MTRSNFDDVGDFHEKFGLDNVTHHGPGPREVTNDLIAFRVKFLTEELNEFITACNESDPIGMFDALLDIVYVAMGTAHFCGFPWQAGWDEVQRASMTKVRASSDGSDSKRESSWDVVKPDGWEPPDLATVIARSVSCPQCRRTMDEVTLTEVISDHASVKVVMVHCDCGALIQERPA